MEKELWGTIRLEEKNTHFVHVGDLYLWLMYRDTEIWIAHCYSGEISARVDEEEPPGEAHWVRWACKSGHDRVQIFPVFANLPLIVQPEYLLKVGPRNEIQIFCRIPVWISISLASDHYTLIELPVTKMSRSEEHTSELQSRGHLVCRLLLEK